jgi:replicative DNA helicase
MIGIDPVQYGGLFEGGESFRVQTGAVKNRSENGHTPLEPQSAPKLRVVTRSSRLAHYLDQLVDMESVNENPPIPFPLRVLHPFGGMTQYIKPGKLIGLVGVSGGGKTSCLETMIDGWLCFNVPCLVWSPEWEADEFIERAVQRYGGPSMADVYAHQVYKQEVKNGITSGGAGKAISHEQITQASDALDILKGWSEEVGYIDEPMLSISQLQAQLDETLKTLSFKPRVLAVDYAQLLHALEADKNVTMYSLLMRIKAICRQYGLVGLIASQVTKSGAKEAAGGDLLDGLAARFVNDDAFNLFITINPDREMTVADNGKKPTGRFLPSAVLNITKSSMGMKGKVRVAVDWERLMFADEKHLNQNFEKGEDYD